MSIIVAAIRKINADAEVDVINEDINSIIWHTGTDPISVADIQEQIPIVEQEMADAKALIISKKASAKAKLLALGLDEDEIKALVGYRQDKDFLGNNLIFSIMLQRQVQIQEAIVDIDIQADLKAALEQLDLKTEELSRANEELNRVTNTRGLLNQQVQNLSFLVSYLKSKLSSEEEIEETNSEVPVERSAEYPPDN